jgi:hypothetical protein
MASIFIVNHSISGPYTQCFRSYHKTEADAAEAFFECKQSVGEDPELIELIALDTETLDAVTHCSWEGSVFDLEEQEAALEAEGMAPLPEDDGICEGEPLPRDGSCAI